MNNTPKLKLNAVNRLSCCSAMALAALACAGLATSPSARAAEMAYEGFSYPSGSGNVTGQSGGFGWNGAWQTVVNGNSSIVAGSLTAGANAPAGYDSHSTGNAAITPNGTRTGRFLDTSAGGAFGVNGYINGSGNIGAAGKTLYISFLQQPNIANNNYYEFELHQGNLNDPGRVGGVGCDTGGSSSVYLRTPAAAQTLIGPASTAVSFYVVRIDFMGGNDTVRVYQNPTSATEPGTPTLIETGAGDMSFNGISFGAFNNGATVAHDEVRVGETWSDVVSPGVYSTGKWLGGGGNNDWSNGGNWDNGVVPVFPSALTFAGSSGLVNTNDLTGISANAITFGSAAGAFTLAGNSLGLNGNISFSANPAAAITQTINLPLAPSTDITVDTPANGNLVLGGNVTSGSALTKTDNGTLTLGGTNTFGALSASGGTNIITGNTAFTGGSGHRFYVADGDFINGCKATLIIQPGATLTVTGNYDDAGVIGRDSGSGTVIQNGGTFTFAIGNNNSLFVGASGSTATRSEYDMNGGLLDMNGNTLGVALGANVVITGRVNQASGVITNVGNLYFSPFFTQGHGIYNLTGGSIYIESGGITVFSGGGYEMNLGGGTIGAEASWSSALNMTLTGANGAVTFNPSGNTITLSGVLSGAGGLNVSGGGTLELSGANSYTGDTTVNAGSTLQWDETGSSSGALRVANGGMLNLNFTGTYAVGSFYTNGVGLPIGTYNAANLPAFISGSGNLQVSSGISTGLWTGGGANNNWSTAGNWNNNAVPIFPHSVTFAGSSRLNNNNDLSGLTISSLTFDSAAGAFTVGGDDITLTGSLGFNGNPATPVTQTVNLNLAWTGSETIDTPSNGNLTLGGDITSSTDTSLIKVDGGMLTLGGTNTLVSWDINGGTTTITGSTTINGDGGSRVYVGDGDAINDCNGTLVIQPGAALTVNGSFGDSMVLGRDSGSATVIQNGGTFTFNPANISYLFVGASGSAATRAEYDMNGGTLDMGGYTLAAALSANNATLITGLVSQASGTIKNVGELDLGVFTLGPGHAIYNLTGGSIYIGGNGIQSDSGIYEVHLGGGTVGAYASWSSPLNMNLSGLNGPVTFDTAGNSITLSGILSGNGGLNVVGGGTLDLSGANSYAGDTTVTAGLLQLDTTGSSAGSFRLTNGANLNLNYSGTFVVSRLYTNGVAVLNGTYNSANLPSFIIGSGNLQVIGVISRGHWTGLGANNNWSTAGNWDGGAEPIFPIDLTFAGGTRLNNTNDLTGITANSLTFDPAAGPFILNGNSLGLNGNIQFNGNPAAPVTETINLPLTPAANINVDTPVNGDLVISGDLNAANNTVYKVDGGLLTLSGTNIFAGYDVDGGTNEITGNTTVTGTGSTRTYVANADYVGGSVGTLIIANGATFTINGNFGDAYVAGRDGGQGRLIQNGGMFTFNPGNQSWIFVGAGNNPSTRGEYDMNGGLLDMNGKNLGLGLGVGVAVTGIVNQVSGVITNVGQLFLNPIFNGGYGFYNLTGGSLYIGSGGIAFNSGGGYQLNFGGGTVGAEASWSSSLNITLTGTGGAVTFDPAGNTILLTGALSGSGGLTVAGGGFLELSGANTYAGDTTVDAGSTLRLDSAGTTTGTFRVATGGGLNLNYIGTYTVGNLYTNGVALANGTYNAANLAGVVSGTGSIQVVGAAPMNGPTIGFTVSNGKITLTWPAAYESWVLQMQTNSSSIGLKNNWVDVAGSGGVTSTNITVNPAIPTTFFRLRPPTQ